MPTYTTYSGTDTAGVTWYWGASSGTAANVIYPTTNTYTISTYGSNVTYEVPATAATYEVVYPQVWQQQNVPVVPPEPVRRHANDGALAANLQRCRDEEAAARQRARELLFEELTETQREAYETEGVFPVTGSDGGEFWIEVTHGIAGNVRYQGSGPRTQHLCAHPYVSGMPNDDAFLTQKLMIEHDELAFRAVANVS